MVHLPHMQTDASVKWIFEAPLQLGLSSAVPGLRWGTVEGAEIADDGQVVVLTNYGGFWEFVEPCNCFLLDAETGEVVRRVVGPAGTIGDWYLDGMTVYVRDKREGQRGWTSLDMETGKRTDGIDWPRGERRRQFSPIAREQAQPAGRIKTYRHQIGSGRELLITDKLLELVCTDPDGGRQTRALCRLDRLSRDRVHVLTNDAARLLLVCGSYVICVDMRDFPPPLGACQTHTRPGGG